MATKCAFGVPRRQVMMDFLKEWETKLQMKITCSQARTPSARHRTAISTTQCRVLTQLMLGRHICELLHRPHVRRVPVGSVYVLSQPDPALARA